MAELKTTRPPDARNPIWTVAFHGQGVIYHGEKGYPLALIEQWCEEMDVESGGHIDHFAVRLEDA